jgi:hypothetical protein
MADPTGESMSAALRLDFDRRLMAGKRGRLRCWGTTPRALPRRGGRSAVFGDVVDGVQQLAHGGDESRLWRLSSGAQALVEGAQPGVAADGAEHRYPQRHAQLGISQGRDRSARSGVLHAGARFVFIPVDHMSRELLGRTCGLNSKTQIPSNRLGMDADFGGAVR